jgi:hypothetical protein
VTTIPEEADARDALPTDSIEDVTARLAARGLVHTTPEIVVPKEPRPETAVRFTQLGDDLETPSVEVPEDEWDVESESSAMSRIRCPQCRQTRLWSDDVTRFRCDDCDRAWRWATCSECDALALAVERQESWRCGECDHVNRAWWRTSTARREALLVVAHRRDAAVQVERARVRAGMRRRRWKIIAGGIVGLLAALGFVVVVRSAEPTRTSATAITCDHFERLSTALATNAIGVTEVKAEVQQLEAESAEADGPVQEGVVALAVAGTPGTAEFLVAQTALADACEAAS